MIDERREAQASLYALGALPLEETREFETALRGDLRLQLLLAELSGALDGLPKLMVGHGADEHLTV